jgi:ribosomal protein L14
LYAKCLSKKGRYKYPSFNLGDSIFVVLQKWNSKKKLKRAELYISLIIRLRFKTKRLDGSFLASSENSGLLFNRNGKFLGTRIYGYTCREIRYGFFTKRYKNIISLSGGTL